MAVVYVANSTQTTGNPFGSAIMSVLSKCNQVFE